MSVEDALTERIREVVAEALAEHREQRRWLDTDGAAEYLSASVAQVRDWKRTKNLPCAKVGRVLRFDARALDAWLESVLRTAYPGHRPESR